MKQYDGYYVTIGLEIHVALNTKEKLFSNTPNNFEVTNFSLFDIGMPGVLPILNKEPVEMAAAFALSCDASLEKYSEFERKHYFYPDLPLGYQITQQHKPIMIGGFIPIEHNGVKKLITIEHAHLECDAAKSLHTLYSDYTAIDISRCASPLLEIVSTPCIHSPEEAVEYARAVYSLVTFLGVCDGKIEEGSFRVDASISINKDPNKLGTRVEIKNISSFGFLRKALDVELERQIDALNSNQSIKMETRLYNEDLNITASMRDKESVDEYRYFIDPDILPVVLDDAFIDNIKSKYPLDYYELKRQILLLYTSNNICLSESQVNYILSEYTICKSLLSTTPTERLLKLVAYWLPDAKDSTTPLYDIKFEDILTLSQSTLSAADVKNVLIQLLISQEPLERCMPKYADDNEIEVIIKTILVKHNDIVIKYKNGETKLIQFLTGKCMGELKGKAPAPLIKSKIEELVNYV